MTERYCELEIGADGVAVLWLDQPGEKVNKLSLDMVDEFAELIARIQADDTVKAAVLISRKDDFIAGADLDALQSVTEAGQAAELSRQGHALLRKVEESPKPVVAAIHGAALGGGLEVALACHARIASDDPKTVVGLPEVQLGLLPAGGGTQRLPKLVGLSKAIDMMLTGRRVYAKPALKMGLVDALIYRGGLLDAARRLALKIAGGGWERKTRKRGLLTWFLDRTPPGRDLVFSQACKKVMKQTRGNYPAPLEIIHCIKTGIELGNDLGYAAEAKGFDKLVMGPVAKQLIGLFKAMTARKRNPWPELVRPVERMGVLGAGFMGAAIAGVSAKGGIRVAMKDRDWAAVGRGVGHIYKGYARRVRSRAMRATERDALVARVAGTVDYTGFAKAEMVIEAVFEDLELKRQMVREVEAATGPETIFASNTSALPIAQIAEASAHPETVIGMHYFSPVEKMPLLEIITHPGTADWVTATAYQVGVLQGKTSIVVGDGPGFYTTRIVSILMNEAMLVLEEGAPVLALDDALKDAGFPVGPVTLLDEVGMDVAAHVSADLGKAFAERGGFKASTLVERMVAAGFKGRKAGIGFFKYGKKGKKPLNSAALKIIGVTPDASFPREQMVERLVLAMTNEAVRCLEEGVLHSAADGDVGAILGLGYPPFTGGPFRYVDSEGVAEVVARLEALVAAHGERFTPSPLLVQMAAEGRRFHDAPAAEPVAASA